MKRIDIAIGEAIRLRRSELQISQAVLADKMRKDGWKWAQGTVWSVETGNRPVRLSETADLTRHLQCTRGQLLGEDPTHMNPASVGLKLAAQTITDMLNEMAHQVTGPSGT